MHTDLTKEEKARILKVIREVHQDVMERCKNSGGTEEDVSSSAYSIQDFLGDIDINENGVEYWDEKK